VRPEDYPPQEPLSEAGVAYAAEVMRRAKGIKGVDHAYGEDPYQTISLHLPEKPNGTILAMVHGGGWVSGYKEHMDFMAPAYTDAGIIFASIGYRLAPQHLFPTGVEDVAAGLAWLSQHATDFGGNPDRIFAGGHSAGGHYTSLLAVRTDWQAALGLPQDVITGCLPLSGVYLFGEKAGMSMKPRFLGEAPNAEDDASPILHINQTPAFLIGHGDDDFTHLMSQAADMETALKGKGGQVDRIVFDGRNHFSACYAGGEPDGPWVAKAIAFMESHA